MCGAEEPSEYRVWYVTATTLGIYTAWWRVLHLLSLVFLCGLWSEQRTHQALAAIQAVFQYCSWSFLVCGFGFLSIHAIVYGLAFEVGNWDADGGGRQERQYHCKNHQPYKS